MTKGVNYEYEKKMEKTAVSVSGNGNVRYVVWCAFGTGGRKLYRDRKFGSALQQRKHGSL